jgi:hypothetical protein
MPQPTPGLGSAEFPAGIDEPLSVGAGVVGVDLDRVGAEPARGVAGGLEETKPMALAQSAVSELLEVLRAGEAVNLVRESVRMVMQELIDNEATEVIGVARYERTDTRMTERNGSRPRTLATQAGDIDLRIPKLRKGSFFPLILEPRGRIDQALYAVVMEAYVAGVSTRSVDDLVAAPA